MNRVLIMSWVYSAGVLAGAFTFGTFGLRRMLAGMDLPVEVAIRRRLISVLSRLMPSLMGMTVVSSGVVMLRRPTQASLPWSAVSASLGVAVFVMTLLVHHRLNRIFVSWGETNPPADARHKIETWNRADTLRWVLAQGCFAAAAMAVSR